MKITASRKDDVLRRKAEYDAQEAAYQSDHSERLTRYNEAERDVLDPIQNYLEAELGKFDLLSFRIDVDTAFRGLEVNIRCDDDRKFGSSSALSWHYEVRLSNKGELRQESGSWSGLQAVTTEQMESLKQTVQALEFINSIDWRELLSVEMPDWDKFMKGGVERPEFHDFTDELDQAEIEDVLGTDTFLLVRDLDQWMQVWVRFVSESSKYYKIQGISKWGLNNLQQRRASEEINLDDFLTSRNVRKDRIHLVHPIQKTEW